jgi:hypothetical protein
MRGCDLPQSWNTEQQLHRFLQFRLLSAIMPDLSRDLENLFPMIVQAGQQTIQIIVHFERR